MSGCTVAEVGSEWTAEGTVKQLRKSGNPARWMNKLPALFQILNAQNRERGEVG